MKEKLEELKAMNAEKIEELFYEQHKNQWFDDESDVINRKGSFKKGFLTAIKLIEEELNDNAIKVREITKEELKNKYHHYLKVGDLKEFLHKYNLPNDANIVVQRVEDIYYEKHNWGVFLKEGDNTFKDENGNFIKESMDQYHPAWCCVKYIDEDDVLFINLHY